MYNEIALTRKNKYGIERSPHSLRCFWCRLARETQIYLSCASTIKKRRVSGADVHTVNAMTMELYRRRNSTKDKDGNMCYSPPFRYVDAVRYLENEPKFSEQYEEMTSPSTRTRPSGRKSPPPQGARNRKSSRAQREGNRKDNSGSDEFQLDDGGGDSDTDKQEKTGTDYIARGNKLDTSGTETNSDLPVRPMGLKRKKEQTEIVVEMRKASKAINSITSEMTKANDLHKESNVSFERSARSMVDIKLLQALPPGSAEYKTLYADIMRERAQLAEKVTHPTASPEENLDGSPDGDGVDEDDEDEYGGDVPYITSDDDDM